MIPPLHLFRLYNISQVSKETHATKSTNQQSYLPELPIMHFSARCASYLYQCSEVEVVAQRFVVILKNHRVVIQIDLVYIIMDAFFDDYVMKIMLDVLKLTQVNLINKLVFKLDLRQYFGFSICIPLMLYPKDIKYG